MRTFSLFFLVGCNFDLCDDALPVAPAPAVQGVYGAIGEYADEDGICDNSEPWAAPDVRVCAERAGVEPVCTQTDALGGYRLDLSPGNWQVCANGLCSQAVPVPSGGAVRVDLRSWAWLVDGEPQARNEPSALLGLRFVHIVDRSGSAAPGAPGVDICSVSVTCQGEAMPAEAETLVPGEGDFLCGAPAPDRCQMDPAAARPSDSACDEVVSLGQGGRLVLEYFHGLEGCVIEVNEQQVTQQEGYAVYLCDGPSADAACQGDAPLGTEPTGGFGRFRVDTPGWSVVTLLDASEEEARGHPGADICDVQVACRGRTIRPLDVGFEPGDGDFTCSEACWTEAAAAIDTPSACEGDVSEITAVSLGLGGSLWVEYPVNVRDCTLMVREVEGNHDEGYEVYVCDGPVVDAGVTCLGNWYIAESWTGGDVTVEVP